VFAYSAGQLVKIRIGVWLVSGRVVWRSIGPLAFAVGWICLN